MEYDFLLQILQTNEYKQTETKQKQNKNKNNLKHYT